MIKGFTTRLERRNLYTTIHRGYSCRYGWFNAKTHEMEWPKDPDRITLIPERTKTIKVCPIPMKFQFSGGITLRREQLTPIIFTHFV